MTTQNDEENRRGGLRGAVDELFGRGDEKARGERDENLQRDDAYAQDSTLDREPGTTTQLGDTQHQTYGDEARGDTAVPEQVQRGAETRSDTDMPVQARFDDEARHDEARHDDSRFDDSRPDDAERGVHSDVAGSLSGDVRHDDATVNDDAAVTAPTTTHGHGDTGSVDDTRDFGSARTDAGQPAGESVGTDTYAQATPAAPATPAASATTAATATHDTGGGHDTGGHDTGTANMAAADNSDAEGRAALVTADRAESYSSRWNDVKGEFVDEPRRAVADADALVGELLDELQELFKAQRADIEHSLDADETSTEDLRLALRRYRSFFDRLLSI
ncbi:MAG TPA: hypothetical protein VGE11_20905 [Pseudonocardia sp.]